MCQYLSPFLTLSSLYSVANNRMPQVRLKKPKKLKSRRKPASSKSKTKRLSAKSIAAMTAAAALTGGITIAAVMNALKQASKKQASKKQAKKKQASKIGDPRVDLGFQKGQQVMYTDSKGKREKVTIVDIHYDDTELYFTIKINSTDSERQTTLSRLENI